MLKPGILESFISQFMPRGNPGIDPVLAADVGAFVRSQSRPNMPQQQAGGTTQ
jgi:cytochrome c